MGIPPKWMTFADVCAHVQVRSRGYAGISSFRSVARLIFSKKPKQENIRAVSLPLKGNNAEIDTALSAAVSTMALLDVAGWARSCCH
jgi:hypothetical protein